MKNQKILKSSEFIAKESWMVNFSHNWSVQYEDEDDFLSEKDSYFLPGFTREEEEE